MINIIRHGKETFRATCPICGCEFTYQAEDLKEDCFHNHHVECPECKTLVSHAFEEKKKCIDPDILWKKAEEEIKKTDPLPVYLPNGQYVGSLDCATCPSRPNPDKPVVGDTPCNWCPKMQPYCISGADYADAKVKTPNLKGDFTTNIK